MRSKSKEIMDKLKGEIWKQLLAKATEFTLQVNDPVRWSKNFLNVTLEKNQEDIINTLCNPQNNYIGILGSRGGGKCVKEDTLLFTSEGMIEIQHLFGKRTNQGDEFPFEIALSTKDGIEKTSHFYNNGVKDTFTVVTQQGYEITGPANHPLLCFTKDLTFKFKVIGDLAVGDTLCIQRNQQLFSKNIFKNVDESTARLLGYLIAEGHFVSGRQITITNEDAEVIKDITEIATGLSLDYYYKGNEFFFRGQIPTENFHLLLKELGVGEGLSDVKEIPRCILQSPKEVVVAFLRAYFEGDGGVEKYTNNKGYVKGIVTCATKSEKLARQLQIVLTNFGIISKRYFTYKAATNTLKKTKRKYWTLQITGENVDKFAKEINFISTIKRNKLASIIGGRRNTNVNIVPFLSTHFTNLYNEVSHEHSVRGAVSGRRLLSPYRNGVKGDVSYSALTEIDGTPVLSRVPSLCAAISEILNKNYFFDTIKEITPGKAYTYDLTVPGSHSFNGNGFINHNTFAICVGLIKMCEDYPGLDVGVFGPRADQATRIVSEMKKILFPSPLKEAVDWDKTTNDKVIFKNGANILALSAAETSLQEGWHFSVIVVDEAHRVSNASMSERIIPMLGSKKISKVVKIGIPLFKNHFYASFSDDKFKFLVHDWTQSPILLKSGFKEVANKRYPTFVLDRMPISLKTKMFPDNKELHYDGDMTEMEFNTQYGMIWMDDINTFLHGDEPETLIGNHDCLMASRAGEQYFFGLDTSSGTLMPGKYDLDFTALAIWRRTYDGMKERVWSREWQGSETLSQIEEIAGIVHPQSGLFPCSFGCVDYSNIGITAVEMFKRLKIPVAGVLFSATETSSRKNFKNAMANQFQFELQAGRVKYPKMESIDRDKIMRKHYHQWLALERIVSVGLNDKISAPPGLHDDGCFVGSTPVPLLDGTTSTLQELAEGPLEGKYTYSIDPDTKLIVPGKILRAWKTGTKETVAVTLDNGEIFRCTSDHQIMLRDGSYKEAGKLQTGDSLMPLYRKVTSQDSRWANYELIKDLRNNKWVGTHKLIASAGVSLNEMVVHHSDYNSRNNNPENLRIISQSAHMQIHNNAFWKDLSYEERIKRTAKGLLAANKKNVELLKDPAYRKRLGEAAKLYWAGLTEEQKAAVCAETSERIKHLPVDKKLRMFTSFSGKHHTEEHKQYISEKLKGIIRSSETCKKISATRLARNIPSWCKGLTVATSATLKQAAAKNSATKSSKKVAITKACSAIKTLETANLSVNQENWSKFNFGLSWKTFLKYRKKFPELAAIVPSNHSVIKVEAGIVCDVYDLSIEKYFNFAIGQGIFVSNCCADFLAAWAADKSATFDKVRSTYRMGITSMPSSIVSKRPGEGGKRFL